MRKASIGVLILAALGLAGRPVLAQRGGLSDREAARHGWLADYRQARELARQTGKPIMLVYRCVP